MLEYEKYQDLQAKTQKTQEEYERQITELENRKEEEVTRQRMQYTAQLEKLKNDLILVRFHIQFRLNPLPVNNSGLRKNHYIRQSMGLGAIFLAGMSSGPEMLCPSFIDCRTFPFKLEPREEFSRLNLLERLKCEFFRNVKKTNNNLVIMKKLNDKLKKMRMKKFLN
jgi:hypothetical protein